MGIVVDSKPYWAGFNKRPILVLASLIGIVGLGFGVAYINTDKPAPVSLLQDQVVQGPQVEQAPANAAHQEADLQKVAESDENYPQVLEPVSSDEKLWFTGETKLDEQGAVAVEITPLHLNMQNNTLYFGVALNTHSVDLSMDIAKLATMVFDSGEAISAESWEGPAGGHHVSGTLSFTLTDMQMANLQISNDLQLSIINADAPKRLFTWIKAD
jgi:hypothetical protein